MRGLIRNCEYRKCGGTAVFGLASDLVGGKFVVSGGLVSGVEKLWLLYMYSVLSTDVRSIIITPEVRIYYC